jgi:hypothetical protein
VAATSVQDTKPAANEAADLTKVLHRLLAVEVVERSVICWIVVVLGSKLLLVQYCWVVVALERH